MKRPHVIVNCASSVDGKIALVGKHPLKLSCEEDMARVHRLRNECDAVLVGIETVLADDPKLTVKEKYVPGCRQPLRVIIDSRFRTPENAEVMKPVAPTLIVTCCREFKRGHVEVITCGDDRVNLSALMEFLHTRGVKKLLVEGGSTIIWSFLKEQLVDKMMVFFSPLIIGGTAPSIAGGEGAESEEETIRFELQAVERLGNGYLVTLIPRYAQ